MSINEYKTSLKNLIDATNNETLLQQWKTQLELDIENGGDIEFSPEEWHAVQEGLADYKNGNIISLNDFIEKR